MQRSAKARWHTKKRGTVSLFRPVKKTRSTIRLPWETEKTKTAEVFTGIESILCRCADYWVRGADFQLRVEVIQQGCFHCASNNAFKSVCRRHKNGRNRLICIQWEGKEWQLNIFLIFFSLQSSQSRNAIHFLGLDVSFCSNGKMVLQCVYQCMTRYIWCLNN